MKGSTGAPRPKGCGGVFYTDRRLECHSCGMTAASHTVFISFRISGKRTSPCSLPSKFFFLRMYLYRICAVWFRTLILLDNRDTLPTLSSSCSHIQQAGFRTLWFPAKRSNLNLYAKWWNPWNLGLNANAQIDNSMACCARALYPLRASIQLM